MNLLSVENLAKSYGERVLFQNVNFGIENSDKIGVIGVNGTGKSTFLRTIAGLESADCGHITKGNGVRIEYLAQNPNFQDNATILDQIFKGNSLVMKVIREYETAVARANLQPGNTILQHQLIELTQQMDACNAWQLETEAKAILTKLGIMDFSAVIKTLSGGQRKRLALAAALINPADLLILDEPTNHIDHEAVSWLEQYLSKYKGALLMVTHDRYFLDRVANRIIELDRGRLYTYTGNYESFLELKTEREELQENNERKRQNLLRNELAWIKRGVKARSTKQKARIERFEELSAQKSDVRDNKLDISIGSSRLGRKIIELDRVCKNYDSKEFIKDFSYIVLRDDRIGIIGPNGSGKSTLLNIIAGRLDPDSGQVDSGQTVKIGYFSQENDRMDENLRVIDYIKEQASFISCADGVVISAAQMLERFLFPPGLQWKPIAKLSGGEKRRLFLLKVLMGSPNILLLDEPTNDLDILTLTILEEYLENFPGAIIAVSHDRYFLDRVVKTIFSFAGEGKIERYTGNYSDVEEKQAISQQLNNPTENLAESKSKHTERSQDRAIRFSYNEQREYEQIEDIIAQVELELQAVTGKMDTNDTDFQLLQELHLKQRQLEERLELLIERWAYLNELAEQIKKQ